MDLIKLTRINTNYENSKTSLKKVCSKVAKEIKAKPFFLYDFAKRTGRNAEEINDLLEKGELQEKYHAFSLFNH